MSYKLETICAFKPDYFSFDGRHVIYLSEGKTIRFINLLTGYTEKSVTFDISDSKVNGFLCLTNQMLVGYNDSIGRFSFYNLRDDVNIQESKVKLSKGQLVIDVISSREQDSFLIYTCSNERKLHGILLRKESVCYAVGVKVDVKTAAAKVSTRNEMSCKSILAHPNATVLFIQSNSNEINVYDYSEWLQSVKQSSKSRNNTDNDNNEADDTTDDISKPTSSLFGTFRKKQNLSCVGKLQYPELPSNHELHSKVYSCTFWDINRNGTLLTVVYNDKITCIYNITQLENIPKVSTNNIILKPLGTYTDIHKDWVVNSVTFCNNDFSFFQITSRTKASSLQQKQLKVDIDDTSSTMSSSHRISMHSLLDSSLCTFFSSDLTTDKNAPTMPSLHIHTIKSCQNSNYLFVCTEMDFKPSNTTNNAFENSQEKIRFHAINLSNFMNASYSHPTSSFNWLRQFSHKHLTSTVSTPIVRCLNLMNQDKSSTLSDMKFNTKISALAINSSLDIHQPVKLSFQLYNTLGDMSTLQRHSMNLIYDTSSSVMPSTTATEWMYKLFDKDIVTLSVTGSSTFFIPEEIIFRSDSVVSIAGSIYNNNSKNTSSVVAVAGESTEVSLQKKSVICFIQYNNITDTPTTNSTNSNAAIYLNYSHMSPWYGDDNNKGDATKGDKIKSFLCLSSEKDTIKLIPIPTSTSTEGLIINNANEENIEIIKLPQPVEKYWITPYGLDKCLVYSMWLTLNDDPPHTLSPTTLFRKTSLKNVLPPPLGPPPNALLTGRNSSKSPSKSSRALENVQHNNTHTNALFFQKLVITSPNEINFTTSNNFLILLKNEVVYDIVFQNIANINQKIQDCVWIAQLQSIVSSNNNDNSVFIGMIGVLTNQRVLLLSSKLHILNSYDYHNIAIEKQIKVQITSIQFMCSSLLYCENDSISYLMPLITHNDFFDFKYHSLSYITGNESISKGRSLYMKIPLQVFASNIPKIVMILNDRIVLSSDSYTHNSKSILCSRPANFGDVILKGLICTYFSLDLLLPQKIEMLKKAFETIFKLYYSKIPSAYKMTNVVESHTFTNLETLSMLYYLVSYHYQSTKETLISSTSCRELIEIIKVFGRVSLPSFMSATASTNFPSFSWLPFGLRFQFANLCQQSLDDNTGLLFLNYYLENNDLLQAQGSDSITTSFHSQSELAYQLSAAARSMITAYKASNTKNTNNKSILESAKHLANLANNYYLLIVIILSSCLINSNSNSNEDKLANSKWNWNMELLIQNRKEFQELYEFLNKNLENNFSFSYVIDITKTVLDVIDGKTTTNQLQYVLNMENAIISTVHKKSMCLYEDKYQSHLLSNSMRAALSVSKNSYIETLENKIDNNSNAIGYRSKSDFILMDNVEELLCLRSYLETVSYKDINSGGSGSGSVEYTHNNNASHIRNGAIDNHNNPMPDKPLSWIDGVGTGQKDWERVTGYWRFSDIWTPTDTHFISTGIPSTKLCFLDLSRYGNLMECFSSNNSNAAITIECSTSPCDVGNGHNTVKNLYDIIFDDAKSQPVLNQSQSLLQESFSYGLRCVIGRGGSLDTGLYHKKDNNARNKLTMEMWIQLDNSNQKAITVTNTIFNRILLCRCFGGPQGSIMSHTSSTATSETNSSETNSSGTNNNVLAHKVMPMWVLHTNFKNEICFTICEPYTQNNSSITTATTKSNTTESLPISTLWCDNPVHVQTLTVSSEYIETENITMAEWNHIAFTLDNTTNSFGHHNNNSNNNFNNRINVTIIINGKTANKGHFNLNPVTEEKLLVTTLYVASHTNNSNCNTDYSNCRITEIRFHSDIKNDDDVSNSRYNYLGLAAKKKRLFYQLKDYKELFQKEEIDLKIATNLLTLKPLHDTASVEIALTPLSLVINPNDKNNKNKINKNSNSQNIGGGGGSIEAPNLQKSIISAPTKLTTKFDLKAPTKSISTSTVTTTTANSVTNVSIISLKAEDENQISPASISTSSATLLTSTDSSATPVSPVTGSVTSPTGAVLSSAAAKRLQNKKSLSKP